MIGIPFYLADPRVGAIESAINDIENEREIMMYMRHEAGHAFNYAYELYKTEEWHGLFGPFRRPYREHYRFTPFSRDYVRHIAGWYAQKHPDEDFAETFAVWLTPRSKWREKYRGWPAMNKLRYVDRICRELSDAPPLRPFGETDFTVEEMEQTIEEFYRETAVDESQSIADLALDVDLDDIFLARDAVDPDRAKPASAVIAEHRRALIDKVAYWTGARRSLVKTLVEAISSRVAQLDLVVDRSNESIHVAELVVYVTTLSVNILGGQKFQRKRKKS